MYEPKSNPGRSSRAEPGSGRAVRVFAEVLRKTGTGILSLGFAAAGAFSKWSYGTAPRTPTHPGNKPAPTRVDGCRKLPIKLFEWMVMLTLFPIVTIQAFVFCVSLTVYVIRALGVDYYFIDYRTALHMTWAAAAPVVVLKLWVVLCRVFSRGARPA
ncbi:hypothetical protein MTO96_012754 [Rhipicephalus appendiculatus]